MVSEKFMLSFSWQTVFYVFCFNAWDEKYVESVHCLPSNLIFNPSPQITVKNHISEFRSLLSALTNKTGIVILAVLALYADEC
jgi:hypothetical protein